jgi:predicted DNA binding CopG/RHH family protein
VESGAVTRAAALLFRRLTFAEVVIRVIVQMRVTEDELAELKRRAAKLGLTMTEFLRQAGGLEE